MQHERSIAIIGAGMAGLSCAQVLVQNGHKVQVFEKSKGVGGRMSTRTFDSWSCDHGAQYFTAKSEDFTKQLNSWLDAGVAAPWRARITSLDADGWQPIKESTSRFVGTPSMTAPAKYLAHNQHISFSTTIHQLERHNKSWILFCKETGKIEQSFDTVILAIPSQQAEVLVLPHSAALRQFCQHSAMQPVWALMVYASAPIPIDFDAAFINQGMFSWIARSSSKPQRQSLESWTAHASTEWSAAHEHLTKEEAAPLLVRGFEKLTGYHPTMFQSHLWRFAKRAESNSVGCQFDHALQLGLCGDWTTSEKVEGAWLSGQALGKHVVQSIT
jgi:renalase